MELSSRDGAAPVRSDPVTDRQLANIVDHTTGIATRVWAEAVGDGRVPDTCFVPGPDPASVTTRARLATRTESRSALVALAAFLTEDGWQVDHRYDEVRLLLARRGEVDLSATYDERGGSFDLTVRSGPLPVGVDRARTLTVS